MRGEVGESLAVGDQRIDALDLTTLASGKAVPDLVQRPQIDVRLVQGRAEPVVDPGVLAEAVQEDHRGHGRGRVPVPVVHGA